MTISDKLSHNKGKSVVKTITSHKNSPDGKKRTGHPNFLLIPRVLASLVSLFIVGIGFKAVMTAHYFARSGRLGMEITVNGPPAVAMGIGIIFWGFIPLTLWFNTKRSRGIWLIFCVIIAALFFAISSHLSVS